MKPLIRIVLPAWAGIPAWVSKRRKKNGGKEPGTDDAPATESGPSAEWVYIWSQPARGKTRVMQDSGGMSRPMISQSRVVDGWALIKEKRITQLSGPNDAVHVFTIKPLASRSPLQGRYAVTIPRGPNVPGPNCTCPNFFYAKKNADRWGYNQARECKHIIAGYLMVSPMIVPMIVDKGGE